MADPPIGRLLMATRRTDAWMPWLVLADALDERGDGRGELLRGWHRVATEADDEVQDELVSWCHAFEEAHHDHWNAFVPRPVPDGVSLFWYRGFVHEVFLRRIGDDVVAWLDALLEQPFARALDHVRVKQRAPPVDRLQRLLSGRLAHHVGFWSFASLALGPAHAEVLASSLTDVRGLDVRANALGDGGLTTLARARWPALASLHLAGNGIAGEGLRALGRAAWPELATLVLLGAPFEAPEVESLADAVYMDRLVHLQLPNCGLGAAGVHRLLAKPRPVLRVLGLAYNGLGDEGLAALTPARLPGLRRVTLQGNEIGPDGADRFLTQAWPHLERVYLDENPIGDAAQRRLDPATGTARARRGARSGFA